MASDNHERRHGVFFSSFSCVSWAKLVFCIAAFVGVVSIGSLLAAEPTPAWPVIPKGAVTWRELAGQKDLPPFDVAASAALVPGWNGEGVVVFPAGREVTVDYTPWVSAEFDLRIGHLAGPGYGAFDVELNGKKLGRVREESGKARPLVSVLRTPPIRAVANRLCLRPKNGCRIALFCITETVRSYQPLPATVWTTTVLPTAWTDGKSVPADFAKRGDLTLPAAMDQQTLTWKPAPPTAGTVDLSHLGTTGTVCAITYLHSPAAFTSLRYRLRTAGPALLTGDGQAFLTLKPGEQQGDVVMPYSKLNPGLTRIAVFLPAGKDARFALETTPLGGARFLSAVPPELDPLRHVDDWPRATITNGLITAELPLPDLEKGYYRGTRRIVSNQYNHNFVLVDGQPVGPAYRVEFNFPVVTVNNVDERTLRKGNAFQLKGGTVFSPLRGFFGGVKTEASVLHEPSGAKVTISGDFAPFRYWFFSSDRAVCLEPFVHIDLAPGESMTWKRFCRFAVKEP